MIQDEIKRLADAYFEEVRTIRRHLHRFPERSFQEVNTSKYIADFLTKENITHSTDWATTGIIATIKGNNPSKKTISLRADIDALPIQELNNVPYKSTHDGIMHACGHDAHTASLMGCMLILNDLKERWEGTIHFIFQPGEEELPGGASLLIDQGLFDQHPSQAIIGQHVMPELPYGKVGFRAGQYMAACDELYIDILGKGGHGALPHKCIDPIVVSAQIILALQQIVSRKANSLSPTVLTIGDIHGHGATNVIPDVVKMKGTLRTYQEEWRTEAHQEIEDLCHHIAASTGAKAEVTIKKGYPSLFNNPALTTSLRAKAEDFLGKENVVELEMRPTAEDFAHYSQLLPACFYRLGVGNEAKGITASVHNPNFDIQEESLITGMGLMSFLAISELAI